MLAVSYNITSLEYAISPGGKTAQSTSTKIMHVSESSLLCTLGSQCVAEQNWHKHFPQKSNSVPSSFCPGINDDKVQGN